MQIPWGSSQALFFLVGILVFRICHQSPTLLFLECLNVGSSLFFFAIKGNNLALFRRFMRHERCQQNVLKFDVFLDCEIFQFCKFWMPCPILEFIMGGIISGTNWKINKQKLLWFSCYKTMANFEAFCKVISSSIHLVFLKSVLLIFQINVPKEVVLCFVYLERYTSTLNFF